MDKNIMAQVFQMDLINPGLLCASPTSKQPVSAKHEVIGQVWFVPIVSDGVFRGEYDRSYQNTQPTTDSISGVQLRNPDTGGTVIVLGTQLEWVTLANKCCGDTDTMTDYIIPDVILEEFPCAAIICTPAASPYVYSDSTPVLGAGEAFIFYGTQNGVAFTYTPNAAGFATIGAALTWAQANLGSLGTWALTPGGAGLQLSSTAPGGSLKLDIKRAGGIATFGSITAGSGGTNGTYLDVPLTGGAGTGATADITVASNAVTVVTRKKPGKGYAVANTLSALPASIGSTTGFSVPVASLQVGS